MPTIKLTTGGSAVVLKSGKPSCTCCDGVCSPEITTVYVEYISDPFGTAVYHYFEMTGSLNGGRFSGNGPNGAATLARSGFGGGALYWYYEDPFTAAEGPPGEANRCALEGSYIAGSLDYIYFSYTPLP